MSVPTVTYAFYSEEYDGELSEKDFNSALGHTIAYVALRIWPNDPNNAAEAYMRAVCAACDVDAQYGFTGGAGSLASVTTGSVSMNFGSGSSGGSSWATDMCHAVDGELVGSGLLFMGLG